MLGQGDLRRDAGTINFTLRKINLPVWSTDRIPAGGERRWIDRRRVDRRRFGRAEPGHTAARERKGERRRTVGTVVAYRAEYGGQTSSSG